MQSGTPFPQFWTQYLLIVNLLWLLLTIRTNFYFTELTFVLLIKKTLSINLIHITLILFCFILIKDNRQTREFIAVQSILQFISIFSSRYIYLRLKEKLSPIKYKNRNVMIFGDCDLSYQIARRFKQHDSGYNFQGFYNTANPINGEQKRKDEKINDCLDYAIKNNINEIYSTVLPESNDVLLEVLNRAELNFVRIKFMPNFESMFSHKVNLKMEHGLPIIILRKEPLESLENIIVKRLFDVAFSVIIFILLLWWIIPILALIIKLTSKGPVFFVQKRSGRYVKVFNCYKLRSMQVNEFANEKSAEKNDYRITSIGKFIRKTNLDELPQFYNVLKGEMSIIGPRPHMVKHTEEYSKVINKYMVRHFLKPGITGWAQVNGYRGDLSGDKMEKRVQHDFWYMENWKFSLDISIVLKTIKLVLKGDDNAY
jgi:putative colanic acid biosynthesis UDP-glucose lipid carrier transferase